MNRRICKKILKAKIETDYVFEELSGRYGQRAHVQMPAKKGRARDLQLRAIEYLKSNVLRYRKEE